MKTTRQKIILELLKNVHLNVQDRRIFNDNPLEIDEIELGIRTILNTNSFFPCKFSFWDSKIFNYDGYVIEKVSESKCFVHFQASGATMNLLVSKTFSFDSVNKAIDFYTKEELKDNIDGIIIKFNF